MVELVLHHMPGACSRTSLVALEECGLEYEDRGVDLANGAQRDPAYLKINPRGKVPALIAGGVVVLETPMILKYLAERCHSAKLIPVTGDPTADLAGLSDLIWSCGALHPLVHRVFRPEAYTASEPDGVKHVALGQLQYIAADVSRRLATTPWWYGSEWSIVDTHVAWCFGLAAKFGFDESVYPTIAAHRLRVEARPSYRRALQRERAAIVRDLLPVPPWYS